MNRWVMAVVALLVLSGCGAESGTGEREEIVVSAAASLAQAFAEIEDEFEGLHPDVDVVLNTGGTSALREQILAGVDADVFASADPVNMEAVASAGEVLDEPRLLAVNSLEIAVPSGNPADVTSLADFSRDEPFLGLCAVEVPCGSFAREALDRAGIDPAIDTEEPDVRALLTKLEVGELDAGIVYVTDVIASPMVDGIAIPAEFNVAAEYFIAVLRRSRQPQLAEDFVEFALSDAGQAILGGFGFSR